MKTEEEIKENKQKLIKRFHQAVDECCYQDAREIGAMIEILKWVLDEEQE